MSNIKQFRIIADVPFDYLSEYRHEGGLSTADAAGLASLVLTPATQCELSYAQPERRMIPNSHGGQTTMYRVIIEGEEAVSSMFLARMARALGACGEFAKLHVAEMRDMEDPHGWEHLVPKSELSGQATFNTSHMVTP